MNWLVVWWALACRPAVPPSDVQVAVVDGGIEVSGPTIDQIRVYDAREALVVSHRPAAPTRRVWVPLAHAAGERFRVEAAGRSVALAVPDQAVVVEVEAPAGQGRVTVADGARLDAVGLGDGPVRAALVLTARRPAEATVELGTDVRRVLSFEAPGQRVRIPFDLERDVRLRVDAGGASVNAAVGLARWSSGEASQRVRIVSVALPTDAAGALDRARPPDRVNLPSPWWRTLLRVVGAGYRPRDDQAPWTWQTVWVRNGADLPVSLLVRATVVDSVGAVAPAFRPRLRESTSDGVQVLVRVPPRGVAAASLPLFVDTSLLRAAGSYERRIELVPLGGTSPVASAVAPLHVSIGSSWASGWMCGALFTSAAGWAWLLCFARGWVAASRTRDLVTVALFGSVTWVAGTALQVLGLGVAAALGPFAPLVTGIADDALRACLLGTLVVLAPRPGTAAIASAVGFAMRGLTLGSFHPVDLLYLGSAVCWLEVWLFASGCTRGTGWRDSPRQVFWRLALGLGGANACATATALVVSVVAYRLYFAWWYVALIIALPGFLYVVAGCGLAVGFAASLRRVSGG